MEEKDIIVRLSGDESSVKSAFSEIIKKASEVGLIGCDLRINKTPDRVRKEKLQNKSSSDIMAKVSASEDAVELFMNDLIEIVSENLGLNSPSTGIKLLSSTSDDKKK